MKIDVIMPKMGESLQEGTITKWLKKEGELVERDEMILEISTDKVDTEVPAPNSGVLSRIIAQEGETIAVGSPIAEIDTEGEAGAAAPAKTEEKPAKAEPKPQAKEPEYKETKPAQEDLQQAYNEPEAPEATAAQPSGGAETDLVMPKMGESLQEGTITKWLKKEGDKVERDEMILEISTDKVDTEVPSPIEGTLSKILVKEGETVEVGAVIAKISSGAAAPKTAQPLPKEEMRQAAQRAHEEFGEREEAQQAPAQAREEVFSEEGAGELPRKAGDKFFSPLVRNIAKEHNIGLNELANINGSGQGGRITKQDLLNYIDNRKEAPVQPKPQPQQAQAQPQQQAQAQQATAVKPAQAPKQWGDNVEVIPMDRMRQLISEHMVMSKHTSAHVTSVAEADVTDIVKYREKHKDEFQKKEGYKLTYTPFFASAGVEALKTFPMVNVSVDGKNIIRHRSVNLGMATALPDGNLIVPVIKGADSMNIVGLARSINDLASRARTKKLNPDDIMGGTFTITNVGTFGTLFGTPIINQPQCGILGVGAIKKKPVVKEFNGEDVIVVRHMMYVSITYDHRVIDGMLAGQYLAEVVKNLENMNEKTIKL